MTAIVRKLPAQTAAKLAAHAERIKATLRHSVIEVGRELTEAKALVTHGEFREWVERETDLTPRLAQLIMGAYRACLKNENFSLLPRSALYLLGAADLPADTLTAISERIDAGDVPDLGEVRVMVREGRRVPLPLKIHYEPGRRTVLDSEIHYEPGRRTVLDSAEIQTAIAEAEHNMPTGAEADEHVAPPEVIEENILHTLERSAAVATATKKILKVPSLDREAKARISEAIERLIAKWRSTQAAGCCV
jgi:hypothetical protein